MRRIVVLMLACCLVAVAPIASAQSDLHLGVWKLNLEKSGATPGPGEPTGTVTLTYEGDELEHRVLVQGDVGGKAINPEKEVATITIDGKERSTPNPAYDTTVWKRIDVNSYEMTRRKDGKVVQTGMSAVSTDGKTLTITIKGTNEKGETLDNVTVYDRR
jgi:hypothetical protein